MNALAIDIGTHCGYAYNRGDEFHAGTWHLMSAKEVNTQAKVRLDRRKDARVKRLCDLIHGLGTFDVIAFEDCEFSTYRLQQQLWAAFRSAIWLCGDAKHFDCINVKTLKKFAGARSSDKGAMARALIQRRPELWQPGYDDNAIDAVWIWIWAQNNLTRM